jgi:hypothetical protein
VRYFDRIQPRKRDAPSETPLVLQGEDLADLSAEDRVQQVVVGGE